MISDSLKIEASKTAAELFFMGVPDEVIITQLQNIYKIDRNEATRIALSAGFGQVE